VDPTVQAVQPAVFPRVFLYFPLGQATHKPPDFVKPLSQNTVANRLQGILLT